MRAPGVEREECGVFGAGQGFGTEGGELVG